MMEGPLFRFLWGTIRTAISPQDTLFLQALAVIIVALGLLWCTRAHWYTRTLHSLRDAAGFLSRSNGRAALAAALIPLALRLVLLPVWPAPTPTYHDEYSYLLAADTFAHGRVTNPAHPLWHSFESFHILQQPTYMSMYPPAQGLVLALGKKLFGHPWPGVWLSFGAMCAALFWACRGWLPAGWSLFAALLAGLQLGSQYWLNSYWGGSVAAIGGCLVVGSLVRLWNIGRSPGNPYWHWTCFALGIAVLANSRPWEGFALASAAGAALAWRWVALRDPALSRRLRTTCLPACAVLLVTAAAMMYYFWRVTGDPLRMPHVLNRATYAVAPLFVWQAPSPPKRYVDATMSRFYLQWEPGFMDAGIYTTLRGFVKGVLGRAARVERVLFGPVFTVLLLLYARRLFAEPRVRMLLFCLGVFAFALLLQRYYQDHYLGPLLGAAMVLKILCLRRLFAFRWRSRRLGMFLAPAIMCAALLAALSGFRQAAFFPETPGWTSQRAAMEKKLETIPGKDLVIVRYSPRHLVHDEWVYNAADIDSSDIVWARDVSEEQNRRLQNYFPDRRVWLAEPDAGNSLLTSIR